MKYNDKQTNKKTIKSMMLNTKQTIKKHTTHFIHVHRSLSFATAVSELRNPSTGAGGKGHVKSASVSSPGPSAADASSNGAQQSDSRYNNKN